MTESAESTVTASNRQLRLIIALVLTLFVAAGLFAWFAPTGTGVYADSPDMRYHAKVYRLQRGTWFHGRIEYIEITIIDTTTNRVVWTCQRHPQAGETPPDYGDRRSTFIQWSPDSTTVTIPVGGNTPAVWSVR